ncbi:MAG: polysaccharide pyruvyl transferase family protein [Nitrospira sp.]|nr:polysaccharide pyruvyl transferase family protein [Nitrospira sp.]
MSLQRDRGPKKLRIAVLGHVGQENLGDEAAFQALLDAVKRYRPHAEVVGISVDPANTSSRYGIPAYPIWRETSGAGLKKMDEGRSRPEMHIQPESSETVMTSFKSYMKRMPLVGYMVRQLLTLSGVASVLVPEILFLLRIRRLLRQVDLLAVAGSQHLNDYVLGPWNFPYTLWKWTMAAKAAGTKVAFVNVGAGPIRTTLGKWFVKQAVVWADYHSYRDQSSIQCLQQLGVPIRVAAVPDLVFTLRMPVSRLESDPGHKEQIVGINPIPFNSADYWVGASTEAYQRYVRVLASFAEWLLSRGMKVVFFPTQLTLDPRVIQDIRACMDERVIQTGSVTEASVKSVDDLCAAIQSMDYVVASRFHGLVFSMLLEKPVIGISYASKGLDLMTYMGQGDYVLDIMTLELAVIQRRFQEMELRQEQIKRTLRERAVHHRGVADAQFDGLFALIG